MPSLDERIDKLLALVERVVSTQAAPQPVNVHVHIGGDARDKLAEMKKKKFAPIEDPSNDGSPAEAVVGMPRPYVS